MSSTKRRHARVAANIEVALKGPDGQSAKTEFIRNISLGGVFVEMADPLAFGSEVHLEFTLPSAHRKISCNGFVVWSTKSSPERGGGHEGIGLRLMDIGISDMRMLAEYIEHELDA